jgi:urea transporter
MKFFLDSILFSYAQIFFSNRRWFGAAALLATFVLPEIGMLALLGVIISNLVAYLLKFDLDRIKSGFYGFNGILFGAASAFYFEVDIYLLSIVIVFIIVAFFISAVLEHWLAEAFNLPGLSLPFIITLYIFLFFLSNYKFIPPSSLISPDFNIAALLPASVVYYLKSLSLILFQPNIISGLILALALLAFSRVLFLLSILALFFNSIFLHYFLPEQYEQFALLTGFNAILTAFALGGSLIIPSRKSFFLVIIATLMVVVLSGFFTRLLFNSALPILVLPFNFIVLTTIYSLKFRKDQTGLVLLYFKPGSPEENFYYHKTRKSRFERFKFIFPELPFFGEWYVSQGVEGEYTHKDDWKYAWDFVITDKDNKEYSGTGDNLKDYFCYNLPVAAPLDGEVVKVVDGIANNKIGDVNINKNWGNTIIIKHQYELYSAISHLEENSIKVKEGDSVKKGEIIAACGNSGRSPYPHIHFQFQTSDKLGASTHKFPLAHFLVKDNERLLLRSFDFPEEKTTIINMETHKIIRKAFNFKFADKLSFSTNLNGVEATEEWKVGISISNEFFISNQKEDKAFFYSTGKVFYFTSYSGKKDSALYYFYLLALQIPLCYHDNLVWEDDYSVAQLPAGFVRYLSEFFLLYKDFIKAKGYFNFISLPDYPENYIISNEIKISGDFPFSITKSFKGNIHINFDGELSEFYFSINDKKVFSAKLLSEGDSK